MLRKLSWVAFITASSLFLACGHGSSRTPAGPEVSAVALDAALGNKFVKAGASGAMVARIGLAARKRSATARPPVNLALLVDTSGSMEGKAIADARAASLALVASLAPEDRISVVVFDSKAEVLLPSTRLDDADAKDLKKKIEGMKATGTTDMANGLRIAINEVTRHLDREGVNRVVLVGDGVPNDDRQILPLVAQAASQGISVTALGLGNDYDETLMGRIAQQSGGRFFYVDDSAKVASFFAEEVTRLHKVVARHAVLEVHPGPGVAVTGVVGRTFTGLDRGVSVPLGDLSLGEQAEVVVELASSAAKDGANVEVLDAVLRYEDGVGGALREERVFVGAKSTQDTASIAQGHVKSVEDAFARAKDAAATLEKIETQRNKENAKQQNRLPLPSPAAAMPAPPKRASADDEKTLSPEQMREQHDRAIRNFQAY
ncbi:MAG: Ca-activated chloride channel [Myxococcales bacterium]|nr:Ca-activated chloride channel [Myxococcales bacterium]